MPSHTNRWVIEEYTDEYEQKTYSITEEQHDRNIYGILKFDVVYIIANELND